MNLITTTLGRDFIKEWESTTWGQPSTDEVLADLLNTDFGGAGTVHDWRNYVGDATQSIWASLTDQQRAAIALDASSRADLEEWG